MSASRAIVVLRADFVRLVEIAQAHAEALAEKGLAAAGNAERAALDALIERGHATLAAGGGGE